MVVEKGTGNKRRRGELELANTLASAASATDEHELLPTSNHAENWRTAYAVHMLHEITHLATGQDFRCPCTVYIGVGLHSESV